MSNLGKMLAMAGMMAALGETQQYGGNGISASQKESDPEWKRKKCKSCSEFHKTYRMSYCKCRRATNKACNRYEKFQK